MKYLSWLLAIAVRLWIALAAERLMHHTPRFLEYDARPGFGGQGQENRSQAIVQFGSPVPQVSSVLESPICTSRFRHTTTGSYKRHVRFLSRPRRAVILLAMLSSGVGECYNVGMTAPAPQYEPRYLAGIVLFNRRDFFEAHEVWESLWLDACVGNDRRFVQALIQAAVGLYHFGNGNRSGATKLYKSSRAYMEVYPSPHLGLDIAKFWRDMEDCFAGLLAASNDAPVRLDPNSIPTIELDPAPIAWPDPALYLDEDE